MLRALNLPQSVLSKAAPVFAALGDPTRLRVVIRLVDGPLSITSLSEGAGMTRQAVTKHLHALSTAGLVNDRWEGRERIWALQTKGFETAQSFLDRISAQGDAALDRLKNFVED